MPIRFSPEPPTDSHPGIHSSSISTAFQSSPWHLKKMPLTCLPFSSWHPAKILFCPQPYLQRKIFTKNTPYSHRPQLVRKQISQLVSRTPPGRPTNFTRPLLPATICLPCLLKCHFSLFCRRCPPPSQGALRPVLSSLSGTFLSVLGSENRWSSRTKTYICKNAFINLSPYLNADSIQYFNTLKNIQRST